MIYRSTSELPSAPTYSRDDLPTSPQVVFYEVTRVTSAETAESGATTGELSEAEAHQLIDRIAAFPRSPRLVFTGGDPLLRPDVDKLICHASQLALRPAISVVASPRATSARLEAARNAGAASFIVELDAAEAAHHDHGRGAHGDFDRTLHLLAALRASHLPIEVRTNLTSANLHQLDDLAELLARFGAAQWTVCFPVPRENTSWRGQLTAREHELVFEKLVQHAERQPYCVETSEAPQYVRYLMERRHADALRRQPRMENITYPALAKVGVREGKGMMFVGATGLVFPSRHLPIVCGMFPWEDVVTIYQQSPVFLGLRDANRLQGKCGCCEYRGLCGGCRAGAYAETADPFAQALGCDYVPRALRNSAG